MLLSQSQLLLDKEAIGLHFSSTSVAQIGTRTALTSIFLRQRLHLIFQILLLLLLGSIQVLIGLVDDSLSDTPRAAPLFRLIVVERAIDSSLLTLSHV